jgi:hypothetical protein
MLYLDPPYFILIKPSLFLEFRTQEADFQAEDAEKGNDMKQA